MAEAYEVLYIVALSFKTVESYNKISAIKLKGWKWGSGELKSTNFKILELLLEKADTDKTLTTQDKCVSADEKSLVAVPAGKDVSIVRDYAGEVQVLVDDEIRQRKG